MKSNRLRTQLQQAVPEMPATFDLAMRNALNDILSQEALTNAAPARKPGAGRGLRRRMVAYVLAALLLLGAVAVAATYLQHNVFEATMGDNPQNSGAITKYDLAHATVGNCDIDIREAAYDGMALYVVYSIRDRTMTEPLGELSDPNDPSGYRYLNEQAYEMLERNNVGWWFDALWIDGRDTNMPSMSGGMEVGSETPGEILFYMMYRLDQEQLYLTGTDVEIAMPIGERQSFDILEHDPETGLILKPSKGLVTFRLDCSIRNGVTVAHPNEEAKLDNLTAWTSEVTYSPIQMYITLGMRVDENAMAKFIDENGDGYYDEDGNLLWAYDGMELVQEWIGGVTLVDQTGKPVFDSMDGFYGNQGYGADVAWFTFPYLESYPDEMYLAPMMDSTTADMTQAVRVK